MKIVRGDCPKNKDGSEKKKNTESMLILVIDSIKSKNITCQG